MTDCKTDDGWMDGSVHYYCEQVFGKNCVEKWKQLKYERETKPLRSLGELNARQCRREEGGNGGRRVRGTFACCLVLCCADGSYLIKRSQTNKGKPKRDWRQRQDVKPVQKVVWKRERETHVCREVWKSPSLKQLGPGSCWPTRRDIWKSRHRDINDLISNGSVVWKLRSNYPPLSRAFSVYVSLRRSLLLMGHLSIDRWPHMHFPFMPRYQRRAYLLPWKVIW